MVQKKGLKWWSAMGRLDHHKDNTTIAQALPRYVRVAGSREEDWHRGVCLGKALQDQQ